MLAAREHTRNAVEEIANREVRLSRQDQSGRARIATEAQIGTNGLEPGLRARVLEARQESIRSAGRQGEQCRFLRDGLSEHAESVREPSEKNCRATALERVRG